MTSHRPPSLSEACALFGKMRKTHTSPGCERAKEQNARTELCTAPSARLHQGAGAPSAALMLSPASDQARVRGARVAQDAAVGTMGSALQKQ